MVNVRKSAAAMLLGVVMFPLLSGDGSEAQCLRKDEDVGQVQYATSLVRDMMEAPEGFHSSFGDKRLARLGDRAGVALMRLYSSDEMLQHDTFIREGEVIRQAFSFPCGVTVKEDRSPNATLFMLEALKAKAPGESTPAIADLTDFVRSAATAGSKCPR